MIQIKNDAIRRVVIMFIISLGCEAIYLLPYLRWSYYDTMLAAFGFTNLQLTSLGSVFGTVAMICYFFGGPIADKFSSRWLLVAAYALTGITGFYFATFPGYAANMVLYVIWAITTTLLMWDTMLRVTRTLGSESQQGRLFGFLEGIRGVFATALSFIMVAVFAHFANEFAGLSGVITFISIACIVAAVLAFLFVPDRTAPVAQDESQKFHIKDLGVVLSNPVVWIVSLIIMCCYAMFSGLTYLTPFATEVLGVTASAAALIAVFRMYACKIFGGIVGGFIADRISIAKTLAIGFIIAIIAVALLAFMPAGASVPLIIGIIMVFAFVIMAMRGIYFGTVGQVNIPVAVTGTAMGVISVIGFTPDIYFNLITGAVLDANPGGGGYQTIFFIMIAFGIVGLILTFALMKLMKKYQKPAVETAGAAGALKAVEAAEAEVEAAAETVEAVAEDAVETAEAAVEDVAEVAETAAEDVAEAVEAVEEAVEQE